MIDDFPIVLTPKSVDVIKRDLAKSLSHVKSSHRIEGVARACGFSTYAALNAAFKEKGAIETRVSWSPFHDYLLPKGLKVSAPPLYKAVAKAPLHDIAEQYPRLHRYGFGFGSNPKPEERKQEFTANRAMLLTGTDDFLRGYALMSQVDKIKTINSRFSSYFFKHLAEHYSCTYPDGEELGPEYVANGSLIAGAIHAGFKCSDDPGNLNADFNVSTPSVRKLEEILRKIHGDSIYI